MNENNTNHIVKDKKLVLIWGIVTISFLFIGIVFLIFGYDNSFGGNYYLLKNWKLFQQGFVEPPFPKILKDLAILGVIGAVFVWIALICFIGLAYNIIQMTIHKNKLKQLNNTSKKSISVSQVYKYKKILMILGMVIIVLLYLGTLCIVTGFDYPFGAIYQNLQAKDDLYKKTIKNLMILGAVGFGFMVLCLIFLLAFVLVYIKYLMIKAKLNKMNPKTKAIDHKAKGGINPMHQEMAGLKKTKV